MIGSLRTDDDPEHVLASKSQVLVFNAALLKL